MPAGYIRTTPVPPRLVFYDANNCTSNKLLQDGGVGDCKTSSCNMIVPGDKSGKLRVRHKGSGQLLMMLGANNLLEQRPVDRSHDGIVPFKDYPRLEPHNRNMSPTLLFIKLTVSNYNRWRLYDSC